MNGSRGIAFWAALGVFQLVFGLAVFGLTRQYYLSTADTAGSSSSFDAFPAQFPAEFQSAIESIPAGAADAELESPDAIAERADQRFQAQEYDAAAALYAKLVEMDPANVALLNNLAITLYYIGRNEEALQRIEQGLALDPEHQRSWLTAGFINSQLGNTEPATTALNNAFRLGADNEIGASAARMLREMGLEPSLN